MLPRHSPREVRSDRVLLVEMSSREVAAEKRVPSTVGRDYAMQQWAASDGESENGRDDSTTVKIAYVPRLKWLDLGVQIFVHGGSVYGLYLALTQARLLTLVWGKGEIAMLRLRNIRFSYQ